MYALFEAFFTELLGCNLPTVVYQLLSFALVSTLLGKFFALFQLDHNKLYSFAVRLAMGIMAILAVSDALSFSLVIGG